MKFFLKPWFWWCLGVSLAALSLIWAAYRFAWPGTGFQGKTFWDWLSLLIIPVALAVVAVVFNQVNTRTERQIAQKRYEQDKESAEKRYERDQEITKQRYEQDKEIAEERYKQDQQIALDKQREDLLQAYLDRMSELLLKEKLSTSPADSEVRNVARTRTISVLRQLDTRRVGDVFTFLREAGLTDHSGPVVSLKDADLSRVKWEGANLSGANLSGANLSGANLSEAHLFGADFSGDDLSGANLSGALLKDAKIDKSQLTPEQIAQAIWD